MLLCKEVKIMSSNKSIKDKMVLKYGKICMMEEAGIRYVPVEERRKIKGYRKTDEQITYHHLKPKCKGGQATEENGALLKSYNHQWLEQQSVATREHINDMLRRYKAEFNTVRKKIEVNPKPEECVQIQAYDYDKELQDMIFEDNLMEIFR